MAHYAFIDENNVVVDVITGKNEDEIVDGISDWEKHYSEVRGMRCIRTSYNSKIRKNYAGINYFYDEQRDAFIPPKPFSSWILDEEKCHWNAPVDYPNDGKDYFWNEHALSWILIQE